MSNGYDAVKKALGEGIPAELLCETCPWDRLCLSPPTMTSAEVEAALAKADAQDRERSSHSGKDRMPVHALMTIAVLAGRDTSAQLCPVFAQRLISPEGRTIADNLRTSMQQWAAGP